MKNHIRNRKYTTMKKLVLSFLVSFLVFFVVNSCNNLDLLPLDRVTAASFYTNTTDFDGAIFASYSSIQDLYGTSTEDLGERGEFWKISLTITDDLVADDDRGGADGPEVDADRLVVRSSDRPYAAAYVQMYEGIVRANIVLEQLEVAEHNLSTEEVARYNGEAKFLRAWFHFQLMKMYGTPPLALEVNGDISDQAKANSSQEDLYAAILSDFADAAATLPPSTADWGTANTGRATGNAAIAYMGKVKVYQKDYDGAIAEFEKVRAAYNLTSNYEDNFVYTTENNEESIFEIQYGSAGTDDNVWVFDDTHSENFKASQGTFRGGLYDAGGGAPGGQAGRAAPTQNLVDEYLQEAGDVRLGLNIYMTGDMYYHINQLTGGSPVPYVGLEGAPDNWSTTGYTIKKYRGERNITPGNHSNNRKADWNNERWYRAAEMKLLHAEALIESNTNLGDAVSLINEIRIRAEIGPYTGAQDQVSLRAEMRHQKRLEMPFEPHRWADIVRWGIGDQVVLQGPWDPKLMLFPFPQAEIDKSEGKLVQNTGY